MVRTVVYLTEKQHRDLSVRAAQHEISVSELVRRILDNEEEMIRTSLAKGK